MCNCGKNTCNSCNTYNVCRNKSETKCVINGCGTNCYTTNKTTCNCVGCISKNSVQLYAYGNCNGYSNGYTYNSIPTFRCNKVCEPKCCSICPVNCPDKYKWAPKRIGCEKKVCCVEEVFVKAKCKPNPQKYKKMEIKSCSSKSSKSCSSKSSSCSSRSLSSSSSSSSSCSSKSSVSKCGKKCSSKPKIVNGKKKWCCNACKKKHDKKHNKH